MTEPGAYVVRPARAADLPGLIAAADEIFRAHPRPAGLGSMGADYPLLFDPGNARNLIVAELGGALVGHTGFVLRDAVAARTRFQVACFGAVFTLPEHRGRGLGTRLVTEAVARARALEADLGLISGARALYTRAGFAPLSPSVRYRVSATESKQLDGVRVERLDAAGLPAVIALHEAEPVRFVRSREDWERLASAGVIFYDPGVLFVVRRMGEPCAYLAVARHTPAPGDGLPVLRVLEMGGDRAAIAAALPAVLQDLDAPALEVVVAAGDTSLDGFAEARAWPRDHVQFPFSAAWWNGKLGQLPVPWYGLNYV